MRRRVDAVDRRWRGQPLRTRLTAAAAMSATIAIVAVVAVAYIAVRHELLSNIDSQLKKQAPDVNLTFSNNAGKLQVSNTGGPAMVSGFLQGILLPPGSSAVSGQPAGQKIEIPIESHDLVVGVGGLDCGRQPFDGRGES